MFLARSTATRTVACAVTCVTAHLLIGDADAVSIDLAALGAVTAIGVGGACACAVALVAMMSSCCARCLDETA